MSPSAVSQRGNVVQQETDFFSIIVAILVLAIALGIHNGKNWARWSIFALPVFGILFGSGFLLGLNLHTRSFSFWKNFRAKMERTFLQIAAR